MFLKKILFIGIVEEQNKIHNKLNLLGLKFSFRDFKKERETSRKQVNYLLNKVDELSRDNHLLRVFIERSIDITKVPPAKGNLRKVQLLKTKLLELVSYILKQNNITFWADYGTLIGTIRHHGFIPWDDDIDLSFLKGDYLKLPKIFEELEKIDENFWFSYEMWDSSIYRFFYKGISLDFFPFEYVDKKYETPEMADNFAQKWHEVRNVFLADNSPINFSKTDEVAIKINNAKQKILGENYQSNPASGQLIYSPESSFVCRTCAVINTDNIFPLKEDRFENLLIPVPNNPLEHLFEHKIYGNYGDVMNFPKIDHSGFDHTTRLFDDTDDDYDSIYKELSEITENYINGNIRHG